MQTNQSFKPNDFFDPETLDGIEEEIQEGEQQEQRQDPGGGFPEIDAEEEIFEMMRIGGDWLESKRGPIWHFQDEELAAMSKLTNKLLNKYKEYIPLGLEKMPTEAALLGLLANGISKRIIMEKRQEMRDKKNV